MPMLERIAGNRELKQDLKTALGSGRIAHSILLVGEPGCGAGFAARCLAADYLYPNGGPHAEAVLRGQDTESIVVRGEGASGQIKVEAIRDARQNIQKSALSSDAEGRVLFIYGAQNLNGASANAMLKIMEEPPEGVCFLLLTDDRNVFLQTVLSRCAVFSQGGGRRVDSGVLDAARAVAAAVPEANEYPLLAATAAFEKDKTLFRAALQVLPEFFRAAVLIKSGAEAPEEYRDTAQKLAVNITTANLMRMITCIDGLAAAFERNENYTLLITRMCAELRRASGR